MKPVKAIDESRSAASEAHSSKSYGVLPTTIPLRSPSRGFGADKPHNRDGDRAAYLGSGLSSRNSTYFEISEHMGRSTACASFSRR